MLPQLIILQLLAHLSADYLFQPQKWSDRKSKGTLTTYHVYHAMVVFGSSYLCSLDIKFWKASLVIALVHLLIDVLKSFFIDKYQKKPLEKFIFFIDQSIHIVVIIGISVAYSNFCKIDFEWDIPLKNIAIITGFILCTKPSNILIKNIFALYSISISPNTDSNSNDKSLPNAGKLIGIVERFMALALVLCSQYTALGFIITAKSILRFEEAKNNEYVLVGTLLSFGIAVLTGILINLV